MSAKMTSEGWQCCKVDTFLGQSLSRGVFYIGVATLFISIVAMVTAVTYVISSFGEEQHNNKPVQAVNLIFSLFSSSISIYQIIISLVLITTKTEYASSLWFVSHVGILTLYSLMFTTRAVVYYSRGHYLGMIFTVLLAVIYEGVFIYFLIVVNSYLITLANPLAYL